MSSILLAIGLHLGKIIQVLKDSETAIADAVKGHGSNADLQAVLTDIIGLVDSGLISIPGVSTAQVAQVISDLGKVV